MDDEAETELRAFAAALLTRDGELLTADTTKPED